MRILGRWARLLCGLLCLVLAHGGAMANNAANAATHDASDASPPTALVLDKARLESLTGTREVQLPHILGLADFAAQGGRVHYRLDWPLPSLPAQPQAVYVGKMGLSGQLSVNGQLVGRCGQAPLEVLRCLYQPQFFRIPSALLHPGLNTLDFEIHATPRQMNGLSAPRVGEADALYADFYLWRELLTVDLQVGLIWLSTLLGLLSLAVGLTLRRETVFLWFGVTSLVNALAALNGVVVHPLIDIDVYNWMVFSTRLVSVPLAFLTLLAIFDKDERFITRATLLFGVLAPAAIALSGNNRTVAFALYAPMVLYCPWMLYRAARWSWQARSRFQALSVLSMALLFGGGVVDWLRLGGQTRFEGIYLTAYTYSGMLAVIGLMLMTRLAAALLQSRRMSATLERQVAERIAYEVTENIPVGTFTVLAQPGQGPSRFAFMSRRFLDITGLDADRVRDNVRLALAIFHPQDRAEAERRYAQALQQQQVFSLRARIGVRGINRWVHIEASPRVRQDGSMLWEGVLIDETEQELARQASERDRAALQEQQMQLSRQQEREALLRDMHDGFGSQLASVRLLIEKGQIPAEQLPGYLQEVSADLHLVVDTLSPDHISLEEALHDMRYRTERRFVGTDLRFDWWINLTGMAAISPRAILQVLRIVQEALHNAMRHGQARRIDLTARYDADDDRLTVSVRDDGVGLPAQPREGRGMANMRHRARELGARLSVSAAQPGTRVELQLDHPGRGNTAP